VSLFGHSPNIHRTCQTQQQFQQFAEKVWDQDHWKRGDPKASTIQAAQTAINCPEHRKGLERIWSEARSSFYKHRKEEREWLSCPRYFRVASEAHDVPAWILDGVEGAESTWGAGGSNLFGLILWDGPVSEPFAASMESAKILQEGYGGSWDASLYRYSGGGYGIGHVEELERGICP
jgi:hypothetical protein